MEIESNRKITFVDHVRRSSRSSSEIDSFDKNRQNIWRKSRIIIFWSTSQNTWLKNSFPCQSGGGDSRSGRRLAEPQSCEVSLRWSHWMDSHHNMWENNWTNFIPLKPPSGMPQKVLLRDFPIFQVCVTEASERARRSTGLWITGSWISRIRHLFESHRTPRADQNKELILAIRLFLPIFTTKFYELFCEEAEIRLQSPRHKEKPVYPLKYSVKAA
jgi:hypothetical protein